MLTRAWPTVKVIFSDVIGFSIGVYNFILIKSGLNPLSANFRKWSNALKQFVGKLSTNCLSVFGHFVGLALKGLKYSMSSMNHHLFSSKIRINLEHSEAQNLEKIRPLRPYQNFIGSCIRVLFKFWKKLPKNN